VELPRLKPIYERLHERGLEIIVIDSFHDSEGALKFIEAKELPYRFLENGREDEEVVYGLFGVRSYPTTYLINEEGKITYAHVGFDEGDEEKYEREILNLLDLP
jgi:peroxiredoxin